MSELKACPNMLCGSSSVKISAFGIPSVVCNKCGIAAGEKQWQAPRPAENKIKAQGIREARLALREHMNIPDECGSPEGAFLLEYANKLEGEE